MGDRVQTTVEQGVARVRLARPEKRNALDLEMFEALSRTQRRLALNRALRVVILCGEGPDFCSGLDVKAVMGNRRAALKLMWKWLPWQANLAQRAGIGWRRLPVPVIAILQGRCWGGGLQIALGADIRIAHPQSSLSIMEGKWGLIPDMGGTLALRDNLSRDQAMRLAMTADVLDAPGALELGLITQIADDPERAAQTLAETLLQRSPDAVAAVKRLYRKSWAGDGRVLARESLYQLRILAGVNRSIAARRARGEDVAFRDPKRW